MKPSRYFILAALIAAFLFSANVSVALEPIPQKSGFSGFMRPGVGYMRFKTNMAVNSSCSTLIATSTSAAKKAVTPYHN
jgi:hypothetical protein